MEQPDATIRSPADVPKPATSLTSKLLNVFADPGEVFEEVKYSKPSAANWLVPVLLAAVAGAAAVFIMFSQPAVVQQIHDQQTKAFDEKVKAGQMTQAQADQTQAMVEKFTGPTMLKTTGSISAVIFSFAQVFWSALVIWLLGRMFLKSKFPYPKALEVAGLATMIFVLGVIVTALLTASLGKAATVSLAFFISNFDPKNFIDLLLRSVDFFSLWLAVVMAVGLARLASVKFSKALLWMLVYWTAFHLFLVVIAFAAGHLSPGAK